MAMAFEASDAPLFSPHLELTVTLDFAVFIHLLIFTFLPQRLIPLYEALFGLLRFGLFINGITLYVFLCDLLLSLWFLERVKMKSEGQPG